MRLRDLFSTTIVVLIVGIGGFFLSSERVTADSSNMPASGSEGVAESPRVGVQAAADKLIGFNLLSNAPSVPGVEMHDEEGRPLTFSKFKGKVVLFNLWATWCPPCMREMPDLNALQAQYGERGFIVVPVASGQQGEEEPAEFLRKRGLNELTTYYDPRSQFLSIFDLETLPITFLIDRNGTMRGGVIGILDWSSVEAKSLIEAFLDEQKT